MIQIALRRTARIVWMRRRLMILLLVIGLVVYALNVFIDTEWHYVHVHTGKWPRSKLVIAKHGAVASEHVTCSDIGRDVLLEGGSAVDAAIAAAICVGTINCFSAGIGGGGFMLIKNGTDSKLVNYREKAPLAASELMYKDHPEQAITGPRAIAVPGELRGFELAHTAYGRLPWKRLLEPSIKLARTGYPVTPILVMRIKGLGDYVFNNTEFKSMFAPNGSVLGIGDTIVRTKFANTLEKIANHGAKVFYEGEIAQAIAADVQELGGLLTEKDLNLYEATMDDTLEGWFHGHRIITGSAPTSGPVLLAILNILEGFEIGAGADFDDVTYHRIIEACKFGFALRMKLGDPTHVHIDATIKQMISKQLAAAIRHNISDAQTYPPTHYAPLYDEAKTHGTMHLSVVDENDQVVTLMSTVNHYFGSKLISARTGIVLDNEMDDFSTPNTTNSFGLPASPMNFIQPGKRPLSSSVPTIVEKDGKFRLALGGSGGSRIITSVLEVLLRDILLESRLDAAVDAVRIHHQLYPNELSVEHGFSDKLATYLESKGHTIAWSPEELSQGTVQAVKRASDGRIHGIPCTMR